MARDGAKGWRTRVGATLVAVILRAWMSTWRVRWLSGPTAPRRILCFWHGTQFPLLRYEGRRNAVVLVSLSRDGALQSHILRRLGMRIVRGSSSRRAAGGLRAFMRAMATAREGVFAVDGPRGPERKAKGGAVEAARRCGAILVPLGVAARPALRFRARWEAVLIPWPFARVVVVEGSALPLTERDPLPLLNGALAETERQAEWLLRGWQ